jgi:paired amphipathic helix protein Sin3a
VGINDALTYLDKVKHECNDNPALYDGFLALMKDFKAQTYAGAPCARFGRTAHGASVDIPTVIKRVRTLFAGRDDLIQGFNVFLPPGSRICACACPVRLV